MKTKLSFCIIVFFCVSGVWAQSRIHTWRMGPLTWNDFTPITSLVDRHSFLEYFLDVKTTFVKKDGLTFRIPQLQAYTSPDYSWVHVDYMDSAHLMLNQCLFDIIEINRRRQEHIMASCNPSYYSFFLKKSFDTINSQIKSFEDYTMNGANVKLLCAGSDSLKHVLDTTPYYQPSAIDQQSLSLGFTLGGGYKTMFGSLGNYFSNCGGLYFNFDMKVKRHYLTLGSLYGRSECKHDFVDPQGDTLIFESELPHVLDLYFAYGFAVVDNLGHTLTPFVGIGLENYYIIESDQGYGPLTIDYRVGVDYHFNFSNVVRQGSWELNSPRYNASLNQSMLNLKIFASYTRVDSQLGNPQGLSINFQLGFGLRTSNVLYH